MNSFFTKCNAWLGKNMFIVVLTGLFVGFTGIIPNDPILRYVVVALFGYMTFVTALGTSLKQFFKVLRKPWLPLWMLILVHFVTPFTAWFAGIVFYPDDPYIRLGYLIGATIPIGVTSVIWTSLAKGNMPVALVAVTLDTLIIPLVLPLFFHVVVGQSIELDYLKLIEELMFMVTIPSIVGMLLHDWTKGRVANFSKSVGGATSKLGLFAVIAINAAVVMPQITWNGAIVKTLLVTLLIVLAGYLVGYLGSYALKQRTQGDILTMIYNVGIRNNACGLVIALSYFPPAVAVPMTLSILFQQPLATIITRVFRHYNPAATDC